jgi:hypothetical protein
MMAPLISVLWLIGISTCSADNSLAKCVMRSGKIFCQQQPSGSSLLLACSRECLTGNNRCPKWNKSIGLIENVFYFFNQAPAFNLQNIIQRNVIGKPLEFFPYMGMKYSIITRWRNIVFYVRTLQACRRCARPCCTCPRHGHPCNARSCLRCIFCVKFDSDMPTIAIGENPVL